MNVTKKLFIAAAITFTLLVAAAVFVSAEVTFTREAQEENYQLSTLLNATTTTAQSTQISGGGGYIVLPGANKVTFYFYRGWGAGNSGSSVFDVDVSPDGVTWYDFNQLYEAAATTTPTLVSTVTLTGTTTKIASMNIVPHTFYAVRCNVTEATDGLHTCQASVEY